MDMHISDAAGNAGRPGRPSLYGETPDSDKAKTGFSVLGGLEPRRSRFKLFRRRAWSASLLSLAAVVLVFGLNGGFGNIGAPAVSAAAVKNDALEEAKPEPPAAVSSQKAVSESVVATIVSEPALGEAERTTEIHTAPVNATENDKPEATVIVAALAQPDITVQRYSGERTPQETGQKLVSEEEQVAPKKRGPKAVPAASKPASKPSGARAEGGAKDKDVDLIAALLAHVSPTASAAPEKKTARIKTPADARTMPASATPRRERNLKTNRDIVTRDSAESLESLVNRCRSLGFFEGELCRLRICSGMWGKDPACPTSTPSSSS